MAGRGVGPHILEPTPTADMELLFPIGTAWLRPCQPGAKEGKTDRPGVRAEVLLLWTALPASREWVWSGKRPPTLTAAVTAAKRTTTKPAAKWMWGTGRAGWETRR